MTNTIIKSYPAYDVIKATTNEDGVKALHADDKLVLRKENLNNPDYQHLNKFMISSVASSALKNNRCPIKAIERAKTNGHDLHFIFELGSCLTSHKQAKKTYIEVSIDDRIYFEGRLFEIKAASNDNLTLKEIESEGYSLMTIREAM